MRPKAPRLRGAPMPERPFTICIGHDFREQEAYDVCAHSLRRVASGPLNIVRLQERDLRAAGIYDRPYRVDEKGQFHDERDGRPFSVAFSFARFLTPLVARANGCPRGWALFCDCDFLFLRDPAELFALADPAKAVMVVQHNHRPPDGAKMDGVQQLAYRRKNWSSLILWNLDHPANDALTPRMVNTMPGRWLHGFEWLPDDLIGALPERWNWLAGHSPTTHQPYCGNLDRGASLRHCEPVAAIHYTDGGPWFDHLCDCPMAWFWIEARDDMRAEAARRAAGAEAVRGTASNADGLAHAGRSLAAAEA